MSNKLEVKLLAEAFDAIVNDNDVAKATRLFKRHWDLAAKNNYAILESADEDFEISNLGDDFNNEIVDDAGSDMEEKFNQVQVAVDELEGKFPGEMSEELQSKFDDLRNIIDEIRLSEDGSEESIDEAVMVIEDIKGEFELAGEVDEEMSDLFDEITSGIQGESADAEEMSDVEDDDSEFDLDADSGEDLEESEEVDLEFEDDASNESMEVEGEDLDSDSFEEVQDSEEDVIYDIEENAEELLAKIRELKSIEDEETETVEEGWTKCNAVPRNKMQNEEEGVVKKGMKLYKGSMSLDKKAGLGVSSTDSKGKTAETKVKVDSVENRGAKQWHKVGKPENKADAGKSMLGKK